VTGNIEIGLRVPPCVSLRALQDFAVRADRAGVGALWFPDSQLLWRDTYLALAVAALATSQTQLGTAVSNVTTRHPSVIASAVRTVQEVAPHRVRLGLGTGSSATGTVGLTATTGAGLEEAVGAVRELMNGSRLTDSQGTCPIYIATAGPRMLTRTARVADGVILPPGLTDDQIDRALETVRPAGLDIVLSMYAWVTSDVPRQARLIKPLLAARGSPPSGTSLPDLYPDLPHARDWEAAVEACSWISDEQALSFVQRHCLFGSPEDILHGLMERHRQFGVSKFLLHGLMSYELPDRLLEVVAAQQRADVNGGAARNG
jgi:5,10-methylenetetrahydromethanopterin reductase